MVGRQESSQTAREAIRIHLGALGAPLLIVTTAMAAHAQLLTPDPIVRANFMDISQIASAAGNVTQMAFGPDGRLYMATFTEGVKRYDYDPVGGLTNPVTVWSRAASGHQRNGSLGIAFHEDALLGPVMYLAPAVSSSFNVTINITQSLLRLTDADGDGAWGEAGEVNQAIVDNLRVTDLHQVNQLLVDGDTLYVGIGSRTRTGGDRSEYDGPPNPDDGEFAYTGAINWIRDLAQLSGDATTANLAGFEIAQHHSDVRPFTSADNGKLTLYSTGFRNVFGIAMDGAGQLWASMNQNEDPLKPDEIHRSSFQDDHGFPKANEASGDWKQNPAALAAGFFETFKDPVAVVGDHASANGLAFTYRNRAFAGHAFVVRFGAGDDLLAIDPITGEVLRVAAGFLNPLDVLADPAGNLLVATFGGGIYRLTLVDDVGDYNGDGMVDAADYVVWRKTLGQIGASLAADADGDHAVTQADYELWRARLAGIVQSAAAAGNMPSVPEPHLAAILLCLIASALTWRCHSLPENSRPVRFCRLQL